MGDDRVFETAKQKAFRLLLVRSRSTEELRSKLQERGFEASVIKKVIDRLLDLKYLDDEAFAKGWARNLAANRLWGDRKIKVSLREKGIPREFIDQALIEAREEIEERKAIEKIIKKKYGKNNLSAINLTAIAVKEKRRLIQNLMGRGFPPDLIFDVLEKSKEERVDDSQ
jgi:regulatory protein